MHTGNGTVKMIMQNLTVNIKLILTFYFLCTYFSYKTEKGNKILSREKTKNLLNTKIC